MTDKENMLKAHHIAQSALEAFEGEKFYSVSALGNGFTLFFYMFGILMPAMMILGFVFKRLYFWLGILTPGESVLDFWSVNYITLAILGEFLVFSAFFLLLIIGERLFMRRTPGNIAAVVDGEGISGETVGSDEALYGYHELKARRFYWNEIESIRYEFDFPSKNSGARPSNRPKLHIFVSYEKESAAIFGAPLSLYFKIRREHPEIPVVLKKGDRAFNIFMAVLFVAVSAVLAFIP